MLSSAIKKSIRISIFSHVFLIHETKIGANLERVRLFLKDTLIFGENTFFPKDIQKTRHEKHLVHFD